MSVDMDRLARILRDAAIAEILPRFRRLGPGMVRQKSEAIDIVTEADEAAERVIRVQVADLMPNAVFIGEESVAARPDLMKELDGADLAIVIDPIDGTSNFAAGMPLFGVMAAVVARGKTIAAIIYDPMGDDFVGAELGGGAWQWAKNSEKVRLKAAIAPPTLAEMVGTASVGFLPPESRQQVLNNLAKVRMAACFRCAAHEYRTLAAGHWHFTMFNRLLPWDHLPGALIAVEAGCHVARFDGSAYLPTHNSGGLLLAPDPDSWNVLRTEVFNA